MKFTHKDLTEREKRFMMEGRWHPEPVTWSIDDIDERVAVEGWHVSGQIYQDGKWQDIHKFYPTKKEKGMSIYRVFFVNKESKRLNWEFVVADSDEAAVVKAFVDAELKNIDDYHIRVDRCHGLCHDL